MNQDRLHAKETERIIGCAFTDFIKFGKVVVGTEVIDQISNHKLAQRLNSLKAAKLNLDLILSFKPSKLQFRRVILSPPEPPPLHS